MAKVGHPLTRSPTDLLTHSRINSLTDVRILLGSLCTGTTSIRGVQEGERRSGGTRGTSWSLISLLISCDSYISYNYHYHHHLLLFYKSNWEHKFSTHPFLPPSSIFSPLPLLIHLPQSLPCLLGSNSRNKEEDSHQGNPSEESDRDRGPRDRGTSGRQWRQRYLTN